MTDTRPVLPVQLYNTLTRSVETVRPLEPGRIGIYCCGPTVYNFQHVGNMKTYVFEDVLVRMLRYAGYEVRHVMNITDVGHLVSDADDGEDKMALAMKREQKKSHEIADYYTKVFLEDCDKLHIRRPDVICKATQHIEEMIGLIRRIEANGFTYIANGNVYFDVEKFEKYGELAKLDLEKLKAGARIEVDPNKKSPFDFVLWFTKSKFENQELQWDSPWGRGYPGWHIECSAMSVKYLGEQFDIHCGGVDHIPVHHTNEIAQTESATGKPWVSIWMHSDFMLLNKEKMSKSKGGFMVLADFIERGFDPLSFRYFCLTAHYRSQLNFSYEALEGAQNGLRSMKSSVLALKDAAAPAAEAPARYLERFNEAVLSDLNMPQALACIWDVLADKTTSAAEKLAFLYCADEVLGLGVAEWARIEESIPEEVMELARHRDEARKAKNWAEADGLRAKILQLGYAVEDAAGGAKVRKI